MPAEAFVPDEQTLSQFLLGRLTGADATRVEAYLDTHPEVTATLQSLSGDDTLTAALRDQPPVAEADPEVQTAIRRLERLVASDEDRTTQQVAAGESRAEPRTIGEETEDGLQFLAPAGAPGELGRLGGYRILKVLGAGGMGMVLDAEDPKLGRHVAIKVMRPGVAASPKAVQRFLQEAKAAATVEHDHIVPIYFIGEENGVPYIVMPFLKGEPLDARLKREGRLPAAEIARIGLEAAEGLAAAHAQGLVHRDIKPGNLWIEAPRGRVKVLDFGLARLTGQEGHLTQSGAIVGTPAYMAPEQARGQKADARSDLFSLGGVMYRAATGRTPFGGTDTMSMLMSLAADTPANPRSLNPDLPPHLAAIILRLLDKDPARRPQSARELIALLAPPTIETLPADAGERRAEFSFDDEPTAVEPPRATPVESEVTRSKRGMLINVAVAMFLVLVGGGLAAYKLVFESKDGTLYVEINDKDVEARFKNSELQILDDKGNVKYTLKPSDANKKVPPGDYKVQMKGPDGLDVDTHEFTMKKGGQVTVRVTARPMAVAARKEPPPGGTAAGGWALEFDGKTSYVTIPSFKYGGGHPLTVEAWAVLDRSEGSKKSDVILSCAEQSGFYMNADAADDKKWGFAMFFDGYVAASARQPVPRHRPVHLAGVYDGKSELRFYVDGKLQSRAKANGAYHPSTAVTFALGGDPYADGHVEDFFKGQIHGVRLSRVARYDGDFAPGRRFEPDADTLAQYRFDEGQGDLLRDASSHGHDGKIIGARWVRVEGGSVEPPAATAFALECERQTSVKVPKLVLNLAGPLTIEGYVTLTKKVAGHQSPFTAAARMAVKCPDGTAWALNANGVKAGYTVNGPPAVLNERTHVAAVFDGQHFRLFVNGKRNGEKIIVSDNQANAEPTSFQIATELTGLLAEIRVSNVARYTADFTPANRFEPDADTLALYHCDEGTGNVLRDASGHGHDGTISKGGWAKVEGASHDPDRTAAEWVLSTGGAVSINGGEAQDEIKSVERLPREGFRLTGFRLVGTPKVTDEALAVFKDCKHLTHIYMAEAQVTAAGLAVFKDSKTLTALVVAGAMVSDESMAVFKGCTNLTYLQLISTQLTDVGLAHFKDCKKLTQLVLRTTAATDAGLAVFKDCANISILQLDLTNFTDAGVAHFKDCRKLSMLGLSGTAVTDAGLAYFQDRNLGFLNVSSTAVTDAGLEYLKNCNNLTYLDLHDTKVSDPSLVHFKDFKNLEFLNLRRTKVSAAKIDELHEALPNCKIERDGGAIEPKAAAGEFALRFDVAGARVDLPALPCLSKPQFSIEADVTPFNFAPKEGQGFILRSDSCLLSIAGKDTWGFALMGDGNPSTGINGAVKNRRVHLAAVRDGNTITMFVDGKRIDPYTIPGPAYQVRQGTDGSHLGENFPGLIHQVRISRTVRYTVDFQPPARLEPDADTEALYRFAEGKGDKLADSSGKGRDGKINGAKWVKADGTVIEPKIAPDPRK